MFVCVLRVESRGGSNTATQMHVLLGKFTIGLVSDGDALPLYRATVEVRSGQSRSMALEGFAASVTSIVARCMCMYG